MKDLVIRVWNITALNRIRGTQNIDVYVWAGAKGNPEIEKKFYDEARVRELNVIKFEDVDNKVRVSFDGPIEEYVPGKGLKSNIRILNE